MLSRERQNPGGLNADQVDGLEGVDLALGADLQSAEAMLMALQAQVDGLGLARIQRTGQSAVYEPGDDGDLQLGVIWPNPRFTLNEVSPGVLDGTVTDNLTGLIWLSLLVPYPPDHAPITGACVREILGFLERCLGLS